MVLRFLCPRILLTNTTETPAPQTVTPLHAAGRGVEVHPVLHGHKRFSTLFALTSSCTTSQLPLFEVHILPLQGQYLAYPCSPVSPLGDDAFQIALAGDVKEIDTPGNDGLDIKEAAFRSENDAP